MFLRHQELLQKGCFFCFEKNVGASEGNVARLSFGGAGGVVCCHVGLGRGDDSRDDYGDLQSNPML